MSDIFIRNVSLVENISTKPANIILQYCHERCWGILQTDVQFGQFGEFHARMDKSDRTKGVTVTITTQ